MTVTSAHAGDFALDVAGLGNQVIENVANWYAYDSDSLFLPEAGGSFTITLGAAADDVTHITALPMRGDLLSVTGDGFNLDFSMLGEGQVVIDLGKNGNNRPSSPGPPLPASSGDLLDLTLPGLGDTMSHFGWVDLRRPLSPPSPSRQTPDQAPPTSSPAPPPRPFRVP